MSFRTDGNFPTNLVVVVLLAALLPLLAAFQYHWLGQLSEAENERMRINIRISAARFRYEFDGELARFFRVFQLSSTDRAVVSEQLAAQYAEWTRETEFPELLGSLYWIRNHETDGLAAHIFDAHTNSLEESRWPAVFDDLKKGFRHSLRSSGAPERRIIDPLQPEIPALVVRQLFANPKLQDGARAADAWVVAVLDRDFIVGNIFPTLSGEYFSDEDELAFNFAIVEEDHPEKVIYASNAALSAPDWTDPDADVGIFALRPWDFPERGRSNRVWSFVRGRTDSRWQLLVKHSAGSLEEAVAAVRRRNLAISFGVMLLLGASVLMVVVSTRRAQRLARQQMEFVAGVSHELRTPLAVIRSAGENLADQVIEDPHQTQEYGRIINREGRRLSGMVEKVLLFSRIQSGHASYDLRPVEVHGLIDKSLDASQPLISDGGVKVKVEIAGDLPAVMVDEVALKSAIQNLIANAVKYSEREGVLTIGASQRGNGASSEVQIAIQDDGQGIPSSEVSRIFEPFYRGKDSRDEQIEGSGLGLSLVKQIIEAHGGRVSVTSSPGEGSTFVLHLPVAAPHGPGEDRA